MPRGNKDQRDKLRCPVSISTNNIVEIKLDILRFHANIRQFFYKVNQMHANNAKMMTNYIFVAFKNEIN